MILFLQTHYPWFVALHVIALIAWMCGMLYLPRLYVYHAGTAVGSEASEMLKVMERRLLRAIVNPAMIATWLFGVLLLTAQPEYFKQGWLHVKLTALIAMQICHALFSRWRKQLARDERKHDAKFFRMWNEVPTVLLIIIVIMAVVKPF